MKDPGSNTAVSKMLDEISGYLLRKDENVYKAQAYRRAALIVRSLPYDLIFMEQLDSLKGIGASIAHTIEIMLATGTCPLLEKLRKEFGGKAL